MNFQQIQADIWKRKEASKVLIGAHRGTWGGGIVQNTIAAYQNALMHGADIIEMDVIQSTDGVFYALHDGVEKQVFDFTKDIRTMSSAEIDALPLVNVLGLPMDCPLCRMDDVLETFKGKCLINVDRSWYYWEDVIRQLNRHNMSDQIILKSHVDAQLLETMQALGKDLMYMPILKNENDFGAELDTVGKYAIHVIAAEVLMMSENGIRQAEILNRRLKSQGILAWVNSLTLCEKIPAKLFEQIPEEMKNSPQAKEMAQMLQMDKRVSFCYGLDDNTAILEGPMHAWGKLIDMGFDVIQTDWPALVKNFVRENY